MIDVLVVKSDHLLINKRVIYHSLGVISYTALSKENEASGVPLSRLLFFPRLLHLICFQKYSHDRQRENTHRGF